MAVNKSKLDEFDQMYVPAGFNVTCVIGRVEFNSTGDKSAYEAAFDLIGRHGTSGGFSFPHENGGMVDVTVTFVGGDHK